MTACPAFTAGGPSAIADALRSVDCMAGEATAAAFGRIFGSDGTLTAALTIGLTLYVALFAVGMLTGRVQLGLSTLTPRMMALGLALTFATSWIAYSQVVWTLLSAGPDWIASALLGMKGSAAHAFAERLDMLFRAVADAAEAARPSAEATKNGSGGGGGGTTPADLLSYAALLLLLGTVGVLVTSRIALAALLAVGPIFLILSLFSGTRGLFEGWVKAAVMFALVPLFTVLIGVGSVAMLTPVVADLEGGAVDMEQAATVFVAAAIHCALMAVSLKLVSALTAGWRLPGGTRRRTAQDRPLALPMPPAALAPSPAIASALTLPAGREAERDDRVRSVVAAVSLPVAAAPSDPSGPVLRPGAVPILAAPSSLPPPALTARARDIGHAVRPIPSAHSIKESLA